MRPLKLNPMARTQIARAYHAGARPTELAKHYGVSAPYVLAAVRSYDRKQQDRKDRIAARRHRLERPTPVVEPKPKAAPTAPIRTWDLSSAVGKELGIVAYRAGDYSASNPSLAYISLQHR